MMLIKPTRVNYEGFSLFSLGLWLFLTQLQLSPRPIVGRRRCIVGELAWADKHTRLMRPIRQQRRQTGRLLRPPVSAPIIVLLTLTCPACCVRSFPKQLLLQPPKLTLNFAPDLLASIQWLSFAGKSTSLDDLLLDQAEIQPGALTQSLNPER